MRVTDSLFKLVLRPATWYDRTGAADRSAAVHAAKRRIAAARVSTAAAGGPIPSDRWLIRATHHDDAAVDNGDIPSVASDDAAVASDDDATVVSVPVPWRQM